MEQGGNVYENAELPVPFSDVDLHLYHPRPHADHTGLLPLIYAKGFKGADIRHTGHLRSLQHYVEEPVPTSRKWRLEWKNRKARRAGNPEVQALYTVKTTRKAF